MTFNKISLIAVSLFSSLSMFGQAGLLNAQSAGEIGLKPMEEIYAKSEGPILYQKVNDNDILFEKKVWERIPLNERANFVYYYPERATVDRKPLFQILKEAIANKDITEVYSDENFRTKIDLKDLDGKFYRTDTTDTGKEYLMYGNSVPDEFIVKTELKPSDVKEYRIMGTWYFDRNAGEMKYRLLGLAPIVVDINTVGTEYESEIPLFWVFFPGARQVLYENYAYNERNPAQKVSFDYLFNARKFNSVIYKTDNQYGDAAIEDYVRENAMEQLLEAERIKESIRNFEDDLWNY
ncbi:gliding motility protein GldN [Paenimyroides tangerinum]|uniref:Gliding motility protein GldN n=1 Tax=Paenimyroides tangerinum TaxID=2488728 RepID=A0A3P3WD84_9FLAO|nr:gliding motility protein GldN [Paenimyroides tangerinum]RRJ93125.1 gliding motility protein GldN [Paenimyroides tangerinum]